MLDAVLYFLNVCHQCFPFSEKVCKTSLQPVVDFVEIGLSDDRFHVVEVDFRVDEVDHSLKSFAGDDVQGLLRDRKNLPRRIRIPDSAKSATRKCIHEAT